MRYKKQAHFQKVRDQWRKMAIDLPQKISQKDEREKIHQQLLWLKKQIDYYQKEEDIDTLLDCLDEVSKNFKTSIRKPKRKH